MLFLTTAISIALGKYPISLADIWHSFPYLWGKATHLEPIKLMILYEVRFPRVLIAAICGANLTLAGMILQFIFNNNLVGPHIIGVSSASALGGVVAIALGYNSLTLSAFCFCFGVVAVIVIIMIAKLLNRANIFALVITGIILNGFFSAIIGLIKYMSDDEETLPTIVFWLMGSFATATTLKLALIFLPSVIIIFILLKLRYQISILSLGEDESKMLLFRPVMLRNTVLVLVTLLVALQVSVSGMIAWIGLIIPQVTRLLFAHSTKNILPCAIIGAIFMIIVDDISRFLTSTELPLSIITAMLGAPIFLLMIASKRNQN